MSEQDAQNTFNNQGQNTNTNDSQNTNTDDSPIKEDTPKEKEMVFGPIIGILIIVALLVFGGMYFWGSYLQEKTDIGMPLVDDSFSEFFFDEGVDAPAGRPSFEPTDTPIADDNYTELDLFVDEAEDFGDLDALDAELMDLESGL